MPNKIRMVATAGLIFCGQLQFAEATTNETWRGVHLWLDNDSSAKTLVKTLPALAASGANVVVIEVNYSFEFQAHPELRNRSFVTRATAHELAVASRKCGIRLIPEFNCLGHQSFDNRIEPLLKVYPNFSETSLAVMTNADFYCLSWCPLKPGLNKIVFSLLDELAGAFEADAIHVGMDEVYYLGEDACPRCHGKNPAELFAAEVTTLHAHIVGEKKRQMLMWADRVMGPQIQGISRFDNEHNDTSSAINLIPKDIVMCDWHYEWKTNYPSLTYLAGKGFSVWPAGFQPVGASRAFSDFAHDDKSGRVLGFLATTWNQTSISNSPNWPPIKEILPRWKN